MTWIKICGITNLEDALATAERGSERCWVRFLRKKAHATSIRKPREINRGHSCLYGVEKVGVFVHGANAGMEKIPPQ